MKSENFIFLTTSSHITWRNPGHRTKFFSSEREVEKFGNQFFVFYKLWYDKLWYRTLDHVICGAPTLTLRHLCTDPILFRTHPLLGLLVRYHYRWEGAKIARWKKTTWEMSGCSLQIWLSDSFASGTAPCPSTGSRGKTLQKISCTFSKNLHKIPEILRIS